MYNSNDFNSKAAAYVDTAYKLTPIIEGQIKLLDKLFTYNTLLKKAYLNGIDTEKAIKLFIDNIPVDKKNSDTTSLHVTLRVLEFAGFLYNAETNNNPKNITSLDNFKKFLIFFNKVRHAVCTAYGFDENLYLDLAEKYITKLLRNQTRLISAFIENHEVLVKAASGKCNDAAEYKQAVDLVAIKLVPLYSNLTDPVDRLSSIAQTLELALSVFQIQYFSNGTTNSNLDSFFTDIRSRVLESIK